jgi:hypothetical protein
VSAGMRLRLAVSPGWLYGLSGSRPAGAPRCRPGREGHCAAESSRANPQGRAGVQAAACDPQCFTAQAQACRGLRRRHAVRPVQADVDQGRRMHEDVADQPTQAQPGRTVPPGMAIPGLTCGWARAGHEGAPAVHGRVEPGLPTRQLVGSCGRGRALEPHHHCIVAPAAGGDTRGRRRRPRRGFESFIFEPLFVDSAKGGAPVDGGIPGLLGSARPVSAGSGRTVRGTLRSGGQTLGQHEAPADRGVVGPGLSCSLWRLADLVIGSGHIRVEFHGAPADGGRDRGSVWAALNRPGERLRAARERYAQLKASVSRRHDTATERTRR